jgi:hypothetical protein
MTDTTEDGGSRLDSWKAIATYLDRDERTVQRWERELALPIRRLPGRGRSVFAYTSEIDAWLQAKNHQVTEPVAAVSPSIPQTADAPAQGWSIARWRVAALAGLIILGALAWRLRPANASASDLRVQATAAGVVAVDGRGAHRWTYAFPPAYSTYLAEDMMYPAQTAGDAVYVATAFRNRRADDGQEGGAFIQLDLAGHEQRSFSFTDQVTFNGTSYGPPWVVTAYAIDERTGHRRIAIAAHHAVWDAGIVTVLDEQFHRHGTFVHAGWIEQVQWLAANRLLIGGYSNAHEGGMVALLDPTAPAGIDGQGPEPAGSRYHCDNCATAGPVRMAVMPRTELNRVTASRFNRVKLQVTPHGILARTIEVPQPVSGADAIDALYEFTPALGLVRASFGDHYWEFYESLRAPDARPRKRADSPDRDGPREIESWLPDTGWTHVSIQ